MSSPRPRFLSTIYQSTHALFGSTAANKKLGIQNPFRLRRIILMLLGFLAALVAPISARAQQQETRFKPDATLKAEARVDPTTLAMNLRIVLGQSPGRNGASLPVYINYSSKVFGRSTSIMTSSPTGALRSGSTEPHTMIILATCTDRQSAGPVVLTRRF
jgi:hypothetical protein